MGFNPTRDSSCCHPLVALRLEWLEYLIRHSHNSDQLHLQRNWMTLELVGQRFQPSDYHVPKPGSSQNDLLVAWTLVLLEHL